MVTFNPQSHKYNSVRNVVYAKNGMTASTQPLASSVGIEVMKNGGNAIDAAVAMAGTMTITVTAPSTALTTVTTTIATSSAGTTPTTTGVVRCLPPHALTVLLPCCGGDL